MIDSRLHLARVLGFLLLSTTLSPAIGFAQDSPPADEKAESQDPASVDQDQAAMDQDQTSVDQDQAKVDATTSEKAEKETPCSGPEAGSPWLDRFQQGVQRTVCSSAYWFDSFFGQPFQDIEEESSFGRLGVTMVWDEVDGFDPRTDAKVRLALPRLENRFNAFVGRFEEQQFVSGNTDDLGGLPQVFADAGERDWLVGLGYSPEGSAGNRWDFDVGIKLHFPTNPFVNARYRHFLYLSGNRLATWRQITFWQRELGFGTTTRINVEQVMGEKYHLRWQTSGTFAEETEGVDWRSSVTLYHDLGARRALAWQIEANGESDALVAVPNYGFRGLYRQSIFREWFFLEGSGRLFWARREDRPRELAWGLGFGFEMLFGDHPLRRPPPNRDPPKTSPRAPS